MNNPYQMALIVEQLQNINETLKDLVLAINRKES